MNKFQRKKKPLLKISKGYMHKYARKWWPLPGSNWGRTDYESDALTN